MHEALEILLKVGVESYNVICVITILGIEALSKKVDVSSVGLDRHFEGSSCIMRRVRAELLEVKDGLVRSRAWLLPKQCRYVELRRG